MTATPFAIVILENDPICILGLERALESLTDFQVIIPEKTLSTIFGDLEAYSGYCLILDPDQRQSHEHNIFLELQQRHSQLKILFLTALSPVEIPSPWCKLQGWSYYQKGESIEGLIQLLQQLQRGEQLSQPQGKLKSNSVTFTFLSLKGLYQVRQSGIQQIHNNLQEVNELIKVAKTSWDQFFWQGRKRELEVAEWLVKHLLPIEPIHINPELFPISNSLELASFSANFLSREETGAIISLVWNHTLDDIKDLKNETGIPLEIDILQPERKQELLYLILSQTKKNLDELKFLKFDSPQINERLSLLLRELWEISTINFLSKYYQKNLQAMKYDMVDLVLRNADFIQEEFLDKIPLIQDLFNYLILEKPLLIDNVEYRPLSPEALQRGKILLHHLILQIANAVLQVILNNFTEDDDIKGNLYHYQYFSSRSIARFRNHLSWRYFRGKYWDEPQNIFDSQYHLFYFENHRILTTFIYNPRQQELNQLVGWQWWVTIVLEFRDAFTPRIQAFLSYIGQGIVYLLTQIVGRGLGLIVKGIVQGMGNTITDLRFPSKKN